MPRLTARQLSELLGVRPEKISFWHKRGVITGERSVADRRQVLFDVDEVRAAILKHNLRVSDKIFNS
jgi:hypothetical protein